MYAIRESNGRVWLGNLVHRRHVPTEEQWGHAVFAAIVAGRPIRDALTGRPVTDTDPAAVSVTDQPERIAALGIPVP